MNPLLLTLPLLLLTACGGGSNDEGENPGDCSDNIDNDSDGQTDCFDAGCSQTVECSSDSDLEARLADLESTVQSQSEEIAAAVSNNTERLDAVESETDQLSNALSELEDRVATLESSTSDLVVSVYEVDCNNYNVQPYTWRCDVVTGVPQDNPPMVQIFNLRDAEEGAGAFDCWSTGSYCLNADRALETQSPGMGLRYDADDGIIFAGTHYAATSDAINTLYTVVVIGDRAYSAP